MRTSSEAAVSVAYALRNLKDRGKMFIGVLETVQEGMINCKHSRDNDLEVNRLKRKKLTNMRASGSRAQGDLAPRRTWPLPVHLQKIAHPGYGALRGCC